MKKSLRIVFFGNEKIATGVESSPIVFNALIENGYDVAALVIHASDVTSRKQKTQAIVLSAEQHGIPVLNIKNLSAEIDSIKDLNADVGVLVAYGKIIPGSVTDVFPRGIINIHPSLLPSLRGSTPVESAILLGLKESAVSVMQLAPEMDAGPVYAQKRIEIAPDVTKQALCQSMHEMGRDMILKVLDGIDDLEPEQQNHANATFCGQINKQDGLLDFSKPALELEREVRAYAGWPKSFCTLFDMNIAVLGARTADGWGAETGTVSVNFASKQLRIQCKSSSLEITRLQPAGKNAMDTEAFLNGYKQIILKSDNTEIH